MAGRWGLALLPMLLFSGTAQAQFGGGAIQILSATAVHCTARRDGHPLGTLDTPPGGPHLSQPLIVAADTAKSDIQVVCSDGHQARAYTVRYARDFWIADGPPCGPGCNSASTGTSWGYSAILRVFFESQHRQWTYPTRLYLGHGGERLAVDLELETAMAGSGPVRRLSSEDDQALRNAAIALLKSGDRAAGPCPDGRLDIINSDRPVTFCLDDQTKDIATTMRRATQP